MFEELLTDSQAAGEDERSFNLRLAFARYLPPERRLGLLEQRRAVLENGWPRWQPALAPGETTATSASWAERQQDSLSLDVSWLDRLIQEERAGNWPDWAGGHRCRCRQALQGRAHGLGPRRPTAGGQAGPPRQCFTIAASGARPGGTHPPTTDNTEPIKDGN